MDSTVLTEYRTEYRHEGTPPLPVIPVAVPVTLGPR